MDPDHDSVPRRGVWDPLGRLQARRAPRRTQGPGRLGPLTARRRCLAGLEVVLEVESVGTGDVLVSRVALDGGRVTGRDTGRRAIQRANDVAVPEQGDGEEVGAAFGVVTVIRDPRAAREIPKA